MPGKDTLQPLPFQRRLLDYLKTEEADLYRWFSSTEARGRHVEAMRLELLKATYRLDRSSHPGLHASVDAVLASLGLTIPVTLYQADGSSSMNASLHYIPGEGHIVFSGPILSALSEEEVRAMLAHELTHYYLYEIEGGEFFVAHQVALAMAHHAASAPSHIASARLWTLYTEIFADRGASHVIGRPEPSIAVLIKIFSGLKEVSVESYLKQADEILSKDRSPTQAETHPEPFVRARALRLWTDKGPGANDEITRLIEGSPPLDDLDLLAQKQLTASTRRILDVLLQPSWFRSEPVLAHARQFFPDFTPDAAADLDDSLKSAHPSVRDYVCSLLLDFAAVDPSLEEAPMAAAFQLSERMGWGDRFSELASRDLKLPKKTLSRVRSDAAKILSEAASSKS